MKEIDILAVGELNVDLILTGLGGLPVPGREIIAKTCTLTMGSSTAICAAGAARLGMKTAFMGKVGRDDYGALASRSLEYYGVDIENLIVSPEIQTGITVSMSGDGNKDRAMVTYLGAISALRAGEIPEELIEKTRHIHVGSFFLQSELRPGLAALFAHARSRGVTTSLDAGWDDSENWDYGIREVLAHTDVFFPNELEARAISGIADTAAAAAALSGLCSLCAVKCGPDGAILARNGKTAAYKTYPAPVRDTTGAGDSFNAGFLYGFVSGMEDGESVKYANACGAISVTKYGGASSCASLEEAREVIARGEVS